MQYAYLLSSKWIYCMNQTLKTPQQGSEIQEIDEVRYLVSRLDESRPCNWYISELQQGRPVVVPHSKRGHLVGILKKKKIYTKSTTLVVGQWVSFVPCEQRGFRP
jgi:hypothetical protein